MIARAAAVAALAAALLPAPAAADVTHVAAGTGTVTIRGEAPAGPVTIYALRADQEDWHDGTPAATATSDGTFSASAARVAPDGLDRYHAKFVAVSDGAAVGGAHYVDDAEFPAAADFPYPTARSKKGLQVQDVADAEELGVGHAAINVAFNELMYESPGAADAIPFGYGGRTYWFRGSYLESLDRQIRPLSDDGVLVDLILILYDTARPNSAIEHLIHPDAARGQGTVYAFNTKTADGVAYYTAAMEFLTRRYTREDQRYGRAVGYIVGNEVDSAWVWQNMGDQPVDRFVEYYARAVRIAAQAAREAWAPARVYVSLDHMWNAPYAAGQPTRYYAGREILDRLAALGREQGDYGWDVAHHPYPENLFEPDFWHDTTATDSFDTTRVTFKNLAVLPAYMRQGRMTYRGEERRIILSEQGFHTPPGEAGETLQAAAYALAYYEVRFLDGIDAFILHRHVDHQGEGGLLLGVRRWDPGRFEPSAPGLPKRIYDVFRDIDTDRSLAVTDFAKAVIGIHDWSELVPGFDPSALADRPRPAPAGVRVASELTGASAPAGEWRAAENATALEGGGAPPAAGVAPGAAPPVTVRFNTEALLWRGAEWRASAPVDTAGTPWLSVSALVAEPDAPMRPDARFEVKLKAYAPDGRIAEGVAAVTPGRWSQLAMDVSGLDRVAKVKAWVRGTTNDDWAGAVTLRGVTLARGAVPSPGANLDVDAALGEDLTLTVRNRDVRPLTGELELSACDGIQTPDAVELGRVEPGMDRTYKVPVTASSPADPRWPRICMGYHGMRIERVADVADPTGERALPASIGVFESFEDGTAGWTAGENVTGVSAVGSMANGPGLPRLGRAALDAASGAVPADAWRTVAGTLETPLDLSDASSAFAFFDGYGGAPGATGYEARLTLHSADGTTRSTTARIGADTWSRVTVPVSGWTGRNRVTAVEAAFRAVGSSTPWAPHFQVDFMGTLR